MRIEAATVCVNYAGELSASLPYTLNVVDRLVVATDPADDPTREVCRKYGVETLLSDEHKRGGADFAKGRMVEAALRQLSDDCWHLSIDADVVMPMRTRHLLEAAWLDESKVYGCDRVLCRNADDWCRLKASGWLESGHFDYHCRVNFPKGYEVGTRWADLRTGWNCIGFWCLAHASALNWRGVRLRGYPSGHGSAAREDVQQSMKFTRRQRELLPEIIVAHLESEPAKLGANWKGRTTKPFDAGDVPAARPRPRPVS